MESIIPVALAHTVSGSVGLAVNGTLFNQADAILVAAAVIPTGLFACMVVYEIRHREKPRRPGWWPQTGIEMHAE